MPTLPPDTMPPAEARGRNVERRRIEASFRLFDVPEWARVLVREAMDDPRWDWYLDCDGCTAVSEAYWPTKYFPPCLRHDFDWYVGNPVWPANLRFYRLQRLYRMTRFRAGLRFVGVTFGWYAWFKWKHLLERKST